MRQSGFTLYELMITLAISSSLSALAIPSMMSLINQHHVINTSNDLFTSLYLARSHAITKQMNVYLCQMDPQDAKPSPDTSVCSSDRDFNANWSAGWLIFADRNNNGEFDQQDNLLHIITPNNAVNVVFNQRGRLRYFSNGSARSAGFFICDKNKQHYRHAFLLFSGRARISQTMTIKEKQRCDKVSA